MQLLYSGVDEKTEMYQEENAAIEEQIGAPVQNYMEYESDIFEEFKEEDSIIYVSMYPELKSDTPVQSQIFLYMENNQKLRELKEQKIDAERYRWLLYFGK